MTQQEEQKTNEDPTKQEYANLSALLGDVTYRIEQMNRYATQLKGQLDNIIQKEQNEAKEKNEQKAQG